MLKRGYSPQKNEFSTPGKAIFSLARLGHPYFVILCFLSSGALMMISATFAMVEGGCAVLLDNCHACCNPLLFNLAACSASFNRKLEDWKIARKIH